MKRKLKYLISNKIVMINLITILKIYAVHNRCKSIKTYYKNKDNLCLLTISLFKNFLKILSVFQFNKNGKKYREKGP